MCACSNTQPVAPTIPARAGVSFKVEDMTCAHCAGTISDALTRGMPGAAFTVDLEHQVVTVDGDAARAEAIIRDAGYEPAPLAI